MTEFTVSIQQAQYLNREGGASYLSRQGFVKLAGLGLLGIFFPQGWFTSQWRNQVTSHKFMGRITDVKVDVYDQPSYSGNKVKIYWRDNVIPIAAATIGDDEPSYNRVWYKVGNEGYIHSGVVQPVYTLLNQPSKEIPVTGVLAEVSVPYTDARKAPSKHEAVIYRFYFDTLYWVTEAIQDIDGDIWYGVFDDKWKTTQYVLARHMHLIPNEDLLPISPNVPLDQKRIEVHTNEQIVIAYEGDVPVFMSRAATGAAFRDGTYFTPAGRHIIFCKRPCRHMAAGDLASNGYDLPGVPWICYITENGVAFHGTYWHNDFGKKRSHGCINLPSQAARWIYRWTQPVVPPGDEQVYVDYGTTVDVL